MKTLYCDEFEKVTITCTVPIVIAGGPKFLKGMSLSRKTDL